MKKFLLSVLLTGLAGSLIAGVSSSGFSLSDSDTRYGANNNADENTCFTLGGTDQGTAGTNTAWVVVPSAGFGKVAVINRLFASGVSYPAGNTNGVVLFLTPTNSPLIVVTNAGNITVGVDGEVPFDDVYTNVWGSAVTVATNTFIVFQDVSADNYYLGQANAGPTVSNFVLHAMHQNAVTNALTAGDLIWPMHLRASLPWSTNSANPVLFEINEQSDTGIFRGDPGRPVLVIALASNVFPRVRLVSGEYLDR